MAAIVPNIVATHHEVAVVRVVYRLMTALLVLLISAGRDHGHVVQCTIAFLGRRSAEKEEPKLAAWEDAIACLICGKLVSG